MAIHRRILLQVTIPSLVISVTLAVVCVVGIRSLNRLQNDRARILTSDVASLEAAQEMEIRLRQVRFHALMHVMDPTPAREALLDEDHAQLETAIRSARTAADGPEELDLIGQVEAGYRAYRREIADPNQRVLADADRAAYLAWADAHPVRPLVNSCDKLLVRNRQSLQATTAENESLTERTRAVMFLLGVLGPLAGLIGGVGIARALSRSYTRLRLRIGDTHAELDRELGTIRVTAEGDARQLDRQMEGVLARVQIVVEQLQQRQRELQRAEQMAAVGHLAAGVAHEVRNPLTGVAMLVQAALANGPAAALTQDELRMILDDLRRVERTVQGLLDYARPANRQRERLDIGEEVRRVAAAHRGQAGAHCVEFDLEQVASCFAVVDRDQFTSLFSNLIINAIQASPPGGVVRLLLDRCGGSHLRFEITDEGPGIADTMTPKLFTPFATDKPNGTGLGLCLARRIVRDHGGDIAAKNVPGGGASFTVEWPESGEDHAEIAGRG